MRVEVVLRFLRLTPPRVTQVLRPGVPLRREEARHPCKRYTVFPVAIQVESPLSRVRRHL